MEIRTYKAIIRINNKTTTMIVSGKNKTYLKKTIIDFYKKINQIKDRKDIQVILIRVEYANGDYKEIN